MYYPATMTPYSDGSGGYGVTFVDLPGCVSVGTDLEDALRMGQESLTLHLSSMLEDGDYIPTPSTIESARKADIAESAADNEPFPEGIIWQYILVDVPKPKSSAEAPVRISISLRASIVGRIDAFAQDMGMSRSAVINVAAREYIQRMQA